MEFLIGTVLAVVVCLSSTFIGLDRDRALYPTQTIFFAGFYILFGVMGGSEPSLLAEMAAGVPFIVAAVWGFRRSLWIVAAALFAHGVFDWFHAGLITDPGVPAWWAGFCGSYDVVAAAYLAWLLKRRVTPAQAGVQTGFPLTRE